VELDLLLELLQLALQGVDALGQRLLLGLGHPAGLLLGVGQALQPGVEGLLQLPLRRAGQAGVAHGQGHQQLAGLHRLALLHGQALHPRHLGRHDAHQPAGRDEHPADLHAPAALPPGQEQAQGQHAGHQAGGDPRQRQRLRQLQRAQPFPLTVAQGLGSEQAHPASSGLRRGMGCTAWRADDRASAAAQKRRRPGFPWPPSRDPNTS
jgi:hypothetical protein